jgi:hypothetical protein
MLFKGGFRGGAFAVAPSRAAAHVGHAAHLAGPVPERARRNA